MIIIPVHFLTNSRLVRVLEPLVTGEYSKGIDSPKVFYKAILIFGFSEPVALASILKFPLVTQRLK
jgi:hypothetical protein